MNLNRLKMNNDKTKFLLVGCRHQLLKCESHSLNVCDVTVTKSDSLKYLGVYIDSQLNLKEQIREKCKTAAMNLHYIRQIQAISDYRCMSFGCTCIGDISS